MKTPSGMTTITVSVCSRCGTIAKSGKPSCCGRGGSWFKNCGGAGNTKLDHTWYEGIQACKARSKFNTVIGHELRSVQQKTIGSSHGADMTNHEAVIAAPKTSVFTSVNKRTRADSPDASHNLSDHASDDVSPMWHV